MKFYQKLVCSIAVILFCILCYSYAEATETTQKLYQDITINQDGSITVKEAALLSGNYNGRLRDIAFKNEYANHFTGIYSNFVGNTDIYDGTEITDIIIADISQDNFHQLEDIHKIEKIYQLVTSASKGDYGVYTQVKGTSGISFKIFCPSDKNKVFYMQYRIKNAVVVHQDIAELYWNVLGNDYEENITDFRVNIHLPAEDEDVRIWSHGPLTGTNAILDKKTLSFQDMNVGAYRAETIRIMFDKSLVPNATKYSNVKGKEFILKYEASQADKANATRERARLERINDASDAVIDLQESPSMYLYNRAIQAVTELKDSPEEQQNLLATIASFKEIVNQYWKESIERKINYFLEGEDSLLYLKSELKQIEEEIEEGFDSKAKIEYSKRLEPYYKIVEKKEENIRITCFSLVAALFLIGIAIAIHSLVTIIQNKRAYQEKYYRDFPSDDEPSVLEYLLKEKVTNLSISATILHLVVKKVIKIEEQRGKKKEIILIQNENKNVELTDTEEIILKLLFQMIGNNNRCSLKKLKTYGKTEYKAKQLTKQIEYFKQKATKKAQSKGYFSPNKAIKEIKILYIVFMIVLTTLLQIGVFYGKTDASGRFVYFIGNSLLSILLLLCVVKEKMRTQKGKIEYGKWMAHKRFLKDFSKFNQKELPEIALWERYLVTATVLGCADKVQKAMQLQITNFDTETTDLYQFVMIQHFNNHFVHSIHTAINQSVSTAHTTINIASSSDSSSGGFGGGSSFGGGRPEDGGGGGGRF